MSRSNLTSVMSTTAGLAKLSQQSGLIMPLLAGDSNRRSIHLTTLEIRNKLLSWILTNFSADVALQLQQTSWKKYQYTTQDTDVTSALKTLFNLLYQTHKANTMDQGSKRHQHWPLYEILELSCCQNLLKTILREEQWRDTLTVFSGYWQGFENFFETPETSAPELKTEDTDQEAVTINDLAADLESELQDEPVMVPDDVVIEENHVDRIKERMGKIADLSKNYWHSDNGLMRIYYLIRIYSNRKLGEGAGDKSGPVEKLARLVSELFVYLDHVEARLGAPGLCSDKLTQMLLSLAPDDSKPFFRILRSNLDIQNGQFCVKHRLEVNEKRLQRLSTEISMSSASPTERGLQATKKNLQGLYTRLTQKTITADLDSERNKAFSFLEVAFRDTILNIARFSTKLSPEYRELHSRLTSLSVRAEELQTQVMRLAQVFSEKELEKLATEVTALKQDYALLTEKIPLTCRKFFQENFQRIFDGMSQVQKIYPQFAQTCQKVQHAAEKLRAELIVNALNAVSVRVNLLASETKAVPALTPQTRLQYVSSTLSGALQTVTKHLPFSGSSSASSSVVEDEAKADFLEYLEKLQSNLANLMLLISSGTAEDKRLPAITSLSRHIFDARRLARKISLEKSPVLAKVWHDLNHQINVLRERDSVFARAIDVYGDDTVVEDAAWCEQWNLSHQVPGLAVVTPAQVVETVYGMAGTIRDKLAAMIDKQPADSLYFKAMHQENWQKFAFNQQETTETYTLKLFFNFLWQIREATNPEISNGLLSRYVPGVEWATRLSKLPIQEMAALLDEMPAFLANSGIADLAQQALGLIKFLASGIPGREEGLTGTLTAIASSADHPTLSPVHAVVHSGLGFVASDIPQIMKMIASAARIKINYTKIKTSHLVHPNPNSGKLAYTQPESHSFASRLKNFSRNAGVAIWNNLILPITNISFIRREKREIVKDVVQFVRAPELANKAALAETSQQLRKVLLGLDALADQSGLREHRSLRDKVVSKAVTEANSSDGIMRNHFFKSEWKIVGDQPFLIERMAANQQRLQKTQLELQKLQQKIPAIMLKFTQALKSKYLSKDLLNEFKENRPVIVGFLKNYTEEKQKNDQAILEQLSARQAGQLQKLIESGETPRQIEKKRTFFSNQFNKMRENLQTMSTIPADQVDDLFDSVVRSGTGLSDLPKFDPAAFGGISNELAGYIASHERGVRSMQHQETNLKNALQEKQSVLQSVFPVETATVNREQGSQQAPVSLPNNPAHLFHRGRHPQSSEQKHPAPSLQG